MAMTAERWRFPEARVAVFAKAPVPGRVKTRLARHLGAKPAAAAYKTMLRQRLAGLAAAALAPVELWVAPHPHPWLRALARRYNVALRVQLRGDLGDRMAFALTGGEPAVVVGGDCPGLETAAIGEGLAALAAGVDVVVAPAEDGGYTLIGSCRPPRVLFQHMPWGSGRVMAETRRRLARAGVTARELALSWDVDDAADWRRWRRNRPRTFGSVSRGPYG